MSLQRRAGAPRLIEWTGERCVPWTPDIQVAYEHLHRYMWAAELVDGRRVLDLGSGEGFGASILADRAAEVVGVDIDERTVEHAALNWSSEKVSFLHGSALELGAFEDASFGAVVTFEVIEHLEEHDRLLAEIRRVLADDGLLIISTPDRSMYSDADQRENPFHRRELSGEEFRSLLHASFANVGLWGQQVITGSHLGALDRSAPSGTTTSYFVERAGEEWRTAGDPAPMYLVAVASNEPLPAVSTDSALGDCGLELMRARERELAALLAAKEGEVATAADNVTALRDALEQEQDKLKAEQKRAMRELKARADYNRHRELERDEARARLADARAAQAALSVQLKQAQLLTRRVEESVTWQLFQRIRGRVFVALGERSLLVRSLSLLLRLGGRVTQTGRRPDTAVGAVPAPEPAGEPINLPSFERPTASLIVPLYSRADLTRRCLESIRDNTAEVTYEVILVDDCADAETRSLLGLVNGARVLANNRNEGYLQSVNRGAGEARGDWLVLCNNDIEVTEGWLSSLLTCAEANDDVAVVAPKFLSPDGRLSEAGGILWGDGTGANYGRGDDPGLSRYEYTREIDYGSAAALMVRAEFWQDAGGYDRRYEPMYYEDADLCMEARRRGWRVLYEPASVVVHVEGATAGVDPTAGHKTYQEVNRRKFVQKWGALLESDHPPPSPEGMQLAARRHRGPGVLVVDFRVPMWDRDAGSLRMFEIIRSLQRLGYSVTFLPDNLVPISPYTRRLQRLGVEVLYGPLDLAEELASRGPGLVAAILSRPHSASRWLDTLRELAPSALLLYDTVDLHWVRESRRSALDGEGSGRDTPTRRSKAAALRELELAMMRAADMTITVTEDEKATVLSAVPDLEVTVIPTVHEVAERVASSGHRGGVLFLGGFEHPPNADAARYLVREVMPIVWQSNVDVHVTIVGASAPPEVERLAGPRVHFRGWVEDLGPVLDSARALVVPVRFGAGVKGKVTQALAAGLPVVTTPLGAEGLHGIDGESMLIGETSAELAARILAVVADDALWKSLSEDGQALASETCSLELLDRRLKEALERWQGLVGQGRPREERRARAGGPGLSLVEDA
ncbi:MAG TPA: glycosyltransferase [Solirubrobacteraceae bacterium]|nr:glycosyltransferase [Solirubrobacteraceae bacterium]